MCAEFEASGYRVLAGQALNDFKSFNPGATTSRRSLAVFPRRAVLNVGMLLRDSDVARQVRAYLLNVEDHQAAVTRPGSS